MKLYDPGLSKRGVGRTEPPKTAHSGDPNQWVSCGSDIYEELWADIIGEIANAVTGAGISLDGTDRAQLFQAIKDIADARIALSPTVVANFTRMGSFVGVANNTPDSTQNINITSSGFSTVTSVMVSTELPSASASADHMYQLVSNTLTSVTVINQAFAGAPAEFVTPHILVIGT